MVTSTATATAVALALLATPAEARHVLGPPPGPAAVAAGWERRAFQEAGFAAIFPGAPFRQDVPIAVDGVRMRQRHFFAQKRNGRYTVDVMEPEAAHSREALERLTDAMVASVREAVVRKTRLEIQGHRAWDLELRGNGVNKLLRLVVGDDRIFEILATGEGEAPSPEARGFVEGVVLALAPATSPPSVPTGSWPEFRPPGGGFAVRLPHAPRAEDLHDADGSVVRTWSAEQDGVRYVVTATAAHGAGRDQEAALDAFAAVVAKGLPEQATTTSPTFAVAGRAARELVAGRPGAGVRIRCVIGEETVYQLHVYELGADAGAGGARFLESFRLLSP